MPQRRSSPVTLDTLSTWIASAARTVAAGHIRAGRGELQVYVLVPPPSGAGRDVLDLPAGRYRFDPEADTLVALTTPQSPSSRAADRLRAALTDDASSRAAKEAAALSFAVLLLSDVSAPPPTGAGAGAGAGASAGSAATAAGAGGASDDAYSSRPRAMSSSSLAPALHYEARAYLRALKRARSAASALAGLSFVQHHNYDPLAHRWVAKLRTVLGLSRSAIILRGLHVLPAAAAVVA